MKATRKEAKEAGDVYYFTGLSCKHGHVAKRQTVNGRCSECNKEDQRKAYNTQAYKEKVAIRRSVINETSKKYRTNNKGKINALTAMRYAAKKQRTPKWLSEEDKLRIRCFYQLAAMRNRCDDKKWDVDHIVPLLGDVVCGLHVPWNLRVIPKIDNIKKGNRFHE